VNKPRRRALILVIAGVAALAIAVAVVVFVVVKPESESLAAYNAAADDLRDARRAAEEARLDLVVASEDAIATATSGTAIADSTGPAYISDVATIAAVRTAAESLVTAAGLTLTDGALVSPAPAAIDDLGALDAPADRVERVTAAAAMRERIPGFETAAADFATQAEVVATSAASVDTAVDALLASAHTTGTTDALPALASAETVSAYTAAVAALAEPAEDADALALMTDYQQAWLAGIASHEAAARQQGSVSEPTLIRGVLVANKTYALPSTYGNGLTAETKDAFAAMKAEAAAAGHNIYISSGFRSFSTQTGLYNRYVANDGQADADRYSARPGHSEHQTGLTFDLNTITEAFGATPAGIWVAENGHRFGFVVRYPQGKEEITGYKWEPWHLRYLGVDVATKLHDSGLTLEEYLGITSAY
jgi:LAS superfamily LD-carboxypeptidase LdcB